MEGGAIEGRRPGLARRRSRLTTDRQDHAQRGTAGAARRHRNMSAVGV